MYFSGPLLLAGYGLLVLLPPLGHELLPSIDDYFGLALGISRTACFEFHWILKDRMSLSKLVAHVSEYNMLGESSLIHVNQRPRPHYPSHV